MDVAKSYFVFQLHSELIQRTTLAQADLLRIKRREHKKTEVRICPAENLVYFSIKLAPLAHTKHANPSYIPPRVDTIALATKSKSAGPARDRSHYRLPDRAGTNSQKRSKILTKQLAWV